MATLLRAFRFSTFAAAVLASAAVQAATVDEVLPGLRSAYAQAVVPGDPATLHHELFATVLRRVARSYASDVDMAPVAEAARKSLEAIVPGTGEPVESFRKAINEGLRTLDRHSRYVDAQTLGNERSESIGFGGLGLQVESAAGAIRIVAPMPDSPAARAGLLAGDFILSVDQQALAGVPLSEAVLRMRGEPGTAVSLTVRRSGIDDFTVALTRDTIRRPLLRTSMEGDVLVLKLATFTGAVTSAIERAVTGATAVQPPRGIVLDLRGNPGGLLREAITTADLFLGKGDIVSLRGRAPGRSWQADARELLPGVPMIVLVDRSSASAAELVADALQDNGRAVVMGQRSFGKGSVQTTYPLGEAKGALKLTTALYHGPSGRTVQKSGVVPDIELAAAGEAERSAPEVAPVRTAAARVEPARCSAIVKAADPVVACAVAYLTLGSVDAFAAATAEASP